MSSGVALKQRSLLLPTIAKHSTTGPLDSLRDLLSGVYPDSGVGASDSDDDELRLLQSRSPSVTTPKTSADSEAGKNEAGDTCRASWSTPRQRHRHRRLRNLRSKQNIATNGPIIIVNGNAGSLSCGMQRKTIRKRKKRNLKRRTTRKDDGGRSTDGKPGGGHGRTPPGAPTWTNLQYFATTPTTGAGSPGRSPGRQMTLSQAVQTDFAMIDAKSIERVFAGDSSGIAPELAANILRTLSSERFSWGTLMYVLQADLQPKNGFGIYTWGVRRRGSQVSRLPLPPALSLRPPSKLDVFHISPPKPFLKIEGSRYTAAGLVRSKQNADHQTNGCHLPAQWFFPKHDSRTPGELAIIMGRERNKKKKKKSARDSQMGSPTTQCTGGFSRTLEEGETKQRNMHVSTRSFRLPIIKGADGDKKTGSASQLKSNRLPVSVTRQWPPHHRYGGSMRGPPDPGIDVHFEFSVVKLPRLDRHNSIASPGVGNVMPIVCGSRHSGTRLPEAPPVTPATSIFSPTPSFEAARRSSRPSSTTHSSSSGTVSHHTPLYPPTLLLGAGRPDHLRCLYNKGQQNVPRVSEDGDQPLQESGATTERGYFKPEHDIRYKPGKVPPMQRSRPVHAVSLESVHSHEAVLKMPSIQHEVINNKFRAGAIIKKPRSKTKTVENDSNFCSQ